MGVSPVGVLAVCNTISVSDPQEVLLKVSELVSEIRKLEEEDMKHGKDSSLDLGRAIGKYR